MHLVAMGVPWVPGAGGPRLERDAKGVPVMNPILIKEMRKRMRGMRAFAIVEIYVLTLGVILGLVYWVMASESRNGSLSGAGLWLTAIAIFVQTALICLISPTFTAAAISSEREQETFELLVASLATPLDILVGKVGSSLLYLVLILLGSLPIIGFLYWIGGIALLDVAICYFVMLTSGVAYCMVSFFWSTLVRRAVLAQMLSVASVLVLVIGIPGVSLFLSIFATVMTGQTTRDWLWSNAVFALLRTNPFYAQSAALFPSVGSVPSAVVLHWVPGWIFQVAFSLLLALCTAYLSWRRLHRVREWL
jgi:ABC-2 type transport system permease protein